MINTISRSLTGALLSQHIANMLVPLHKGMHKTDTLGVRRCWAAPLRSTATHRRTSSACHCGLHWEANLCFGYLGFMPLTTSLREYRHCSAHGLRMLSPDERFLVTAQCLCLAEFFGPTLATCLPPATPTASHIRLFLHAKGCPTARTHLQAQSLPELLLQCFSRSLLGCSSVSPPLSRQRCW